MLPSTYDPDSSPDDVPEPESDFDADDAADDAYERELDRKREAMADAIYERERERRDGTEEYIRRMNDENEASRHNQ